MNQKVRFLFACFALLQKALFAAEYFVAPDGVPGNSGSIDAPFSSVQEAHDNVNLQPGDVIYLRGGTYYPSQRTRFIKKGSADNYFVLSSYPGELPVIDANNIPEGNTNSVSTTTWAFFGAEYWKIKGPLHITNGRGAGVYIEDSKFIEFDLVESSYNGKRAAIGGHGFFVYSNLNSDILFKNCDAHHNANHLWKSGEDQLINQYQHGDGWRIFDGTNIKLIGCRAWHNLDDGYDFTQADNTIEMIDCWAAYSGVDDALGSITGTPNRQMSRYEGDGIKLGYGNDTGQHRAIRCLSWNNNSHGWNVQGGPYEIYNSAAYVSAEAAFFGINNQANIRRNTYGFMNRVGDGGGANGYAGISVSEADFVSLDDSGMLGSRKADGGLPDVDFLKLAPGSGLIDAGVDVGIPFEGSAPDIGPFEYKLINDDIPPTISSIFVSSATQLIVVFSETVTKATAENISNYSLNSGATISVASLAADDRTVTLTTSPLSIGVNYALTVNGVEDSSSNANQANDSISFSRSAFSPWIENFEDDLLDGATVDTNSTAWSTSGFVDTGGGEVFAVSNGQFESHMTGNEAVWISEVIDISLAGSIEIKIDLISSPGSGGLESSDYIRTFYKLDGGAETQISEHLGAISGNFENVRLAGLSGSTLQVIIRTKTSSYNERYLWDNVSITDLGSSVIPDINPEISIINDRLKIAFVRDENETNLTYEVQSSTDLIIWKTIARSVSGGAFTDVSGLTFDIQETGNGQVFVEVTENQIIESQRFLRVVVKSAQ